MQMWKKGKCANVEVWGCAGVQGCTCELWRGARVECGRLLEVRRVYRCGGVEERACTHSHTYTPDTALLGLYYDSIRILLRSD